jgi:hypothetical protein
MTTRTTADQEFVSAAGDDDEGDIGPREEVPPFFTSAGKDIERRKDISQ